MYANKIQRLIAYYKRIYNTSDPCKIAKHLGIRIVVMPLGNALGYYRYLKRIRWIFVNENIADNEITVKIVVAHELGHAVLHMKENCCFMAHHTLLLTSKIERQANLFAAELLISDELIRDFADFTLEQFSNCTGIPEELIMLRLRQK